MQININLIKDWQTLILKKIDDLQSNGFKFESFDDWKCRRLESLQNQKKSMLINGVSTAFIDNKIAMVNLDDEYHDNLIHVYYSFESRLVFPMPRKIIEPKNFVCPTHLKNGYEYILNKIKKGESLFEHLSRQIFNIEFMDGMLFDWGIQHFHLGVSFDKKHPLLIQGTKEVLYAIVKEDFFYVVAIEDHGKWASKDLLRIVRDNYPEIIEPYKMKGEFTPSVTFTEENHLELRKAGINVTNELDGEAYSSFGGGINTANGSGKASDQVKHIRRWYKRAEQVIKSEFIQLWQSIPQEKLPNTASIQLNMKTQENDRITTLCEKYDFTVVLNYNEARNDFKSVTIQLSEV